MKWHWTVLSGRGAAVQNSSVVRYNGLIVYHIFQVKQSCQSLTCTIVNVLEGTVKFAENIMLLHISVEQAFTKTTYKLHC